MSDPYVVTIDYRQAGKSRKCDGCGGQIEKGHVYASMSNVDGRFPVCAECAWILTSSYSDDCVRWSPGQLREGHKHIPKDVDPYDEIVTDYLVQVRRRLLAQRPDRSGPLEMIEDELRRKRNTNMEIRRHAWDGVERGEGK